MALPPQTRYKLPGQNLYAPILERSDFSGMNDDSAPDFDADNQIQTAALPDPEPIPAPPDTTATGPARQVATAPPPAPSAKPDAYTGLRDVPPPTSATGAGGGPKTPPPPPLPPPPAVSTATPPPAPLDADAVPAVPSGAVPPPPPAAPTAMDRLKALTPPAAPGTDASQKPSWARRLLAGLAEVPLALGEMRGSVRPDTAQAIEQSILYPGYRKQRAAYETERADIENQLNEELKQKQIEAQAEYRDMMGQARLQTAANIAGAQKDREQQSADRLAEIKSKDYQTFLVRQLQGRASQYQAESANRPDGWEWIPDQEHPGNGWAVEPAWTAVPKGLTIPGAAEGSVQPTSLVRAAQKAAEEAAKKPTLQQQVTERTQVADNMHLSGRDRETYIATGQIHPPPASTSVTIPGLGGANAKLAGDDYLASLPPATANQVKAIAMGQSKIPNAGSRSADAQALRQAVFQYDPSFTEQRAQIRQAFTAGPDGKNIGNLNTATVHLDQFGDVADAMGNGSFQPGNQIWNATKAMFGNSAPTNFAGLKAAVSGEMASALKGNATDQEIHAIAQAIDSKNSPQQLRDYITEQLHVLGAKLQTYHERYQQQIPGDTVWNPVLPSARRVFQKHSIDPTAPAGQGGGGAPAGKIAVISPEGTPGFLDADKWDAAQKRGFRKQ